MESYKTLTSGQIAKILGISTQKVKGIINRNSSGLPITKYKLLTPESRAYNRKYTAYKNSAKTRGYAFEISLEQFKDVVGKNCYYCGIEPNEVIPFKHQNGLEVAKIRFNGIDRLDNTKGYCEKNCVPCCYTCNEMKMDKTTKDFLNKITQIYNKHCKPKDTNEEK